ncbi:uncharacterized protein LOC127838649 [Dreissena polymorpha]|uniref:Prokineticin domain-containing protein n=1 Tax=Dreissena polymorpha TaxID=45954 RepID=A0A9D4S047_DREPO|nr:uncharacterized protein LOC127838649 [Dreissena polymorpha]KAH3884912.1 hypothetical protein DPMN_008898 [Dreissena polymorpha]
MVLTTRIMNSALAVFAVAIFAVTQATICTVDNDCGTGQCCYIKPAFEVVSKKRQSILQVIMPTASDHGVCENYHVADSGCWPLETENGLCGCEQGTSCQFVPLPTLTIAPAFYTKAARSIYIPGPGSFKCVAKSP